MNKTTATKEFRLLGKVLAYRGVDSDLTQFNFADVLTGKLIHLLKSKQRLDQGDLQWKLWGHLITVLDYKTGLGNSPKYFPQTMMLILVERFNYRGKCVWRSKYFVYRGLGELAIEIPEGTLNYKLASDLFETITLLEKLEDYDLPQVALDYLIPF